MTPARPPWEPDQLLPALFRAAAAPAGAVAAACVIAAAVLVGRAGMFGALVGGGVVVAFYLVDLWAFAATRGINASVVLVAVLGEYVAKVSLLAVLMWDLRGSTTIDLTALGGTVTATVVAWTIALAVAALRSRSFIFDLGPSADADRSGEEDHRKRV